MSNIEKEHLSRKAYIYIRQSTIEQVTNNQESRRVQYKLTERAKELGWSDSVIIDEDLGLSGSGTVERTGYNRVVDDVLAHKVGAIFCVDPSRISRNNREWHQLLDHCVIMNTLIIDSNGIYDLNNLNDRMLLGLKGTMSEYEVGIFRQRAQSAILEKAKRGELYRQLPAGYELTSDNACQISADQRVQDAIHTIFAKFRELGSANQVVRWYRTENIQVPARNKQGQLIWKLPTIATIEKVIHNPIYAGAYSYGRTKTEVYLVNGQHRKRQKRLSIDEWKVLKKDHHAAYISWSEFMSNQQRLSANLTKYRKRTRGAVKNGAALLTGLLRCKRCGQMLHVNYDSQKVGNPRYICKTQLQVEKNRACIFFFGKPLEQLIVKEILRVVQPAAISAAEKAEALVLQQHQQKLQHHRNALKQAEYEADRCFEQYNVADPKNRLVTSTLEARWNDALLKVKEIEQTLEQTDRAQRPLSEQERKQLYYLADDLTRVWDHPKADNKIKKQIIQTLIKEIVVDITDDNHIIAFVHWHGGIHTTYQIKRRKKGQRANQLHPDTLKLVQQLAEIVPDSKIAQIFNLLQIKTASGKNWNKIRVSSFRYQHQIPVFNEANYEKQGWVNLTQAAEILGTYPITIRRLIKADIIKARQIVHYSPWIIEKEQLITAPVLQAIKKIQSGAQNALSKNQAELDL